MAALAELEAEQVVVHRKEFDFTKEIDDSCNMNNDSLAQIIAQDLIQMEHLDTVIIGTSQITNLGPLSSELVNLKYLSVRNSKIMRVDALFNLIHLVELYLPNNQIVNVSGLPVNLQKLDLQANYITDVGPLSGLINLVELCLHGNQISDIRALSGLINLVEFDLNEIEINGMEHTEIPTNIQNLFDNERKDDLDDDDY